MIHTDTDGGVIGFTDVQEGNEAVAYLPDLLRVLLIGIFQMLEGACGIHAYCAAMSATLGLKCTSATSGTM